ncbi:MAG: hypothetical protein P9M13_04030 [Candidatus Ancaeobacter aquaticus]|nr:hypothetical protein [Candidatus Ancaeobacter aquaticus]
MNKMNTFLSKVCICIIIVCGVLLKANVIFALYPEDRVKAKKMAHSLEQRADTLFNQCVPFFGKQKKLRLGGAEELGWRIHDFLEEARKLDGMAGDYYKNKRDIDVLLPTMNRQIKDIDEAFIFTKVSDKIKKQWTTTKNTYYRLEVLLQKKVKKVSADVESRLRFAVTKVNRIEKKYVLRELLKNFLGGSELEKFPFPYEKKYLDPEQIGEHFILSWDCGGVKRLDKPLILRFEYIFKNSKNNGFTEEVYQNEKSGGHTYIYKNIGADYSTRGKILHWRAIIIYDNKIVAEKLSSMWNVVAQESFQ